MMTPADPWTNLTRALRRDRDRRHPGAHGQQVLELARELASDADLRPLFEECRSLAVAYRSDEHGRARARVTRWWGLSLFAAAAAAAGVALLVVGLPVATRYETRIGEQRTIIADDDSVITLNTDTELRVRIDGAARRVWLERGQAFFSVTPDPERPFEVLANDGVVRAVGTSFDVSIGSEPGKVRVTVLEGSVEILPRSGEAPATPVGRPPMLLHGESATYGGGATIAQITRTGLEAVKAWREGKMDFDNQRLIDALAEHNRYTTKKIVLGDDHLKDLRISGTLRIGDTSGFLFLLKESLGLTVVEKDEVFVLLSASGSLKVDSENLHPGTA